MGAPKVLFGDGVGGSFRFGLLAIMTLAPTAPDRFVTRGGRFVLNPNDMCFVRQSLKNRFWTVNGRR